MMTKMDPITEIFSVDKPLAVHTLKKAPNIFFLNIFYDEFIQQMAIFLVFRIACRGRQKHLAIGFRTIRRSSSQNFAACRYHLIRSGVF